MEDFVDKNLDETHRDVSEHDIETNWGAMKMVIEEGPYVHDDDKKINIRARRKISAHSYSWE